MPGVFSIHWLRFSFSPEKREHVMAAAGGGWSPPEHRGAFNQPAHLIHESGAKLYYGSAVPAQPIVLEVPGEVCEGWSGMFRTFGRRFEGNCTRFDLACDVEPREESRARLVKMFRDFKRGHCFTKIPRTSTELHQSEREGDGWTAYFGSRQSEKFLRVYDRRGPLRLEWQVSPKGFQRRGYAQMLGASESCPIAEIWRFFGWQTQWRYDWYRQLLDGPSLEPPDIKEARTAFTDAIDQARVMVGPIVWAMLHAGVPLETLSRAPSSPSGSTIAKLTHWAAEAAENGYDGDALCRAVDALKASRS